VEKAVKMFQGDLDNDEIEMSVSVDETYQEMDIHMVILDESRAIQVLVNLLSNAIKFVRNQSQRAIRLHISASYTPPSLTPGDVSYIASRQKQRPRRPSTKGSDGEDMYLAFSVEDTGCGLNEEEMKHLFERFSQASPKTYGQYGGSGLGLFICRELVELQGGQIGLSSVPDQGTTFKFYIKARRDVGTPQEKHEMPPKASTPSRTPKRRRNNSTQSNISSPSRKSSVNSKMSDNMSLFEDISIPVIEQLTAPIHILIVEDNPINQRVMSQQLRQLGCITHTTDHGLEALSFLTKTPFYSSIMSSTASEERLIPLSCVLCDLEMPVMDGLTCIRKIREMEADGTLIGHVPVIAVTANARGEQLDDAIEAGMVSLHSVYFAWNLMLILNQDLVLTKPFHVDDLMRLIRDLVG
jgi:CheY-like chemotaxis protein